MEFNKENMENLSKLAKISQAVGQMSEEQCERVLEAVVTECKTPNREIAMALISGLCQRVGTNRNVSSNVSYEIGEYRLTIKQFQRICNEKGNGTPRQFARAMGSAIAMFAKRLGEEGNLARQMRLDVPSITAAEAIWCSNFQGMNPDCPDTVRRWLIHNVRRKFSA